jgi:YHS domain-containing protein
VRIKSTCITLAIAVATGIAAPAFASDEYNITNGVTTEGAGLGVHGFDTVALSTLNTVARGDASHAVVHDGVTYYFASDITAERFKSDPAQYLPQYGGFCAYAVAKGKKFDGDPRYADIVDGKLYLFVSAAVFEIYLADKENILRTAAEQWPTIKHTPVEEL